MPYCRKGSLSNRKVELMLNEPSSSQCLIGGSFLALIDAVRNGAGLIDRTPSPPRALDPTPSLNIQTAKSFADRYLMTTRTQPKRRTETPASKNP